MQLSTTLGNGFPFDLVAAVLVVYAAGAYLLLRDRPDRQTVSGGMLARLATTLRMPVTLQLSFLYAVAFGGSYAIGFLLLAATAATAGLFTATAMRNRTRISATMAAR